MKLPGILSRNRPVDGVRDEAQRTVILEELPAEKPQHVGCACQRSQPVQDHEVVADETSVQGRPIDGERDRHNQPRRTNQRKPSRIRSLSRHDLHAAGFRHAT
jgi:hypothetical protein